MQERNSNRKNLMKREESVNMGDRAFAVTTVLMVVWITLWILSYDNIWMKIPIVPDIFPLPLPNGNLSYADFVTSVGIIGTLILGLLMGYLATKLSNKGIGGFHR